MIPKYTRYRWFYTSKNSLVVGGKNAEQNDELIKTVLSLKKEFYVFHTSHPGSPFAVILKDKNKVTKEEIEEAAIFTGCFSRAWKEKKIKTSVDKFTTNQLSKDKNMKSGTWRVKGKIEHKIVELELSLTLQKNVLRAVPYGSTKKTLIVIRPGNVDKSEIAAQLGVELGDKFTHDEIVAALPAGGVRKKT